MLTVFQAEGNTLRPLLVLQKNEYPVMDMSVDKNVLFISTHEPPLTSFSDELRQGYVVRITLTAE